MFLHKDAETPYAMFSFRTCLVFIIAQHTHRDMSTQSCIMQLKSLNHIDFIFILILLTQTDALENPDLRYPLLTADVKKKKSESPNCKLNAC